MSKTFKPLDDIIDKTGLKKHVIAQTLGIDNSTFYKWRVNPRNISIDGMEKLAVICNVSFLDVYNAIKKFKK